MEYIWLGITDEENEGNWKKENIFGSKAVAPPGGEKGDYWRFPWETRPREPNGGRKENCAAMKTG